MKKIKYAILVLYLILTGCESTSSNSTNAVDVINIKMGGKHKDVETNVISQTTIGDAYIHEGWNKGESKWKIMNGCQYKLPNRSDSAAYVFALGVDDKYYYFYNTDFKILKNPIDNQEDNGFVYDRNKDGQWWITKGVYKYFYDPIINKQFTFYVADADQPYGWIYDWSEIDN